MATYRIGIGSFNLKDGNIGIGTETTGFGNLKVEGTIKTTDLDVGVSTFTRYSGFEAEQNNITRNQTLSGEYSTTGDIVVGVGSVLTVGLGSTACIGAVECLSIKNHFSVPVGDTAGRNKSSGYAEGTVRYNKDLGTMEFYNGNEWRQFNYQSDNGNRGRGVVMGGTDGSAYQTAIEFFNIATRGNSQNFGSLTDNRRTSGGCSSSIRGLIGGGSQQPSGNVDIIEYITIASEGDSIDFGNLSSTREHPSGSSSSSTRGLWAGGHPNTNVIDYVEISTLGNASDFGDCMSAQHAKGMCSSPTRGVIAECSSGAGAKSLVSFITIASKGNAVRFGDLNYEVHYPNSSSNQVRGIFAMGYDSPVYSYDLNYITIASEGNGVDFGKASYNGYNGQGCASATRAMTGIGGYDGGNLYNVIESVEIATLGNTADFGDLSRKKHLMAVVSDCHGGLGGY